MSSKKIDPHPQIGTLGWKDVRLEYGKDLLQIKVPPYCDILKMKGSPALENPRQEIENALSSPIESRPLEDIITSRESPSKITVAIAVSDETRPVPYHGEREDGILLPLLKRLERIGIKAQNIRIIVATGTHLATSSRWKKEAFGEFIKDKYQMVDHNSNSSNLARLGIIDGVEVKINRDFLEADIHIVTGLAEPHFMAGFSAGRKAICPGLVDSDTTYFFHSAEFMDNPNATNLVLKGNPCHDFALKVAHKARVDFSVNVSLNGEGKLTGVFAGDLDKAHCEAVEEVRRYSIIPVNHEYDIVLTQGGRVATNHYQAAKAAYGVIPVIKRGGVVILAAHNSGEEPVGKDDYRKVVQVLKQKGPGRFTELVKNSRWEFIPDQWQVQKWDQFFSKIGAFDRLIYCTTNIPPGDLKELPGKSGYELVGEKSIKADEMVQKAIFYGIRKIEPKIRGKPRMALVKEGPYAVFTKKG
jgi:nickel-dependent lactate racemase